MNYVKKYKKLYDSCSTEQEYRDKVKFVLKDKDTDIKEAFAIMAPLYIMNQPLGLISGYEQGIKSMEILKREKFFNK